MYFHSIPYFCFLPLVVFLVSKLPSSERWKAITGASLLFYSWYSPSSLIFLFLVVCVSYLVGRELEQEQSKGRRSFILWLSIATFLLLIGVAKYLPTLLQFPESAGFIVPLGLSFYTFQAVGYLVDVYRRTRKFEPHFGLHLSFICFFPTLLSGPIERSESLLPQLQQPADLTSREREKNLLLFYGGLFKKLVIADALAKIISVVFQHPEYFTGFTLLLGIALARYMIFADFSGYADMAVASAGLLGIKIRQNFMRPFFATSLIEYWRRWHISLHDWMKDYVFFSLSVSAAGRTLGIYFCLILSFLFMGAWHDIGWNFLAVGLWHGVFISLDYATRDFRQRFARQIGLDSWPILYKVSQILITFVCFVLPPTVFFLAKDLTTADEIFRRVLLGDWSLNQVRLSVSNLVGGSPKALSLLIQTLIAILGVEILHVAQSRGGLRDRILNLPRPLRLVLYVAMFLVLILFGQTFGERPYIYFQF